MKKGILVSITIFLVALLSIGAIALVQPHFWVLEIAFIAMGIALIGFMCGMLSHILSQNFRKRA